MKHDRSIHESAGDRDSHGTPKNRYRLPTMGFQVRAARAVRTRMAGTAHFRQAA